MLTTEKISVLYLDDEEANLTAFKASFRREHSIRTASTAEEAYALLQQQEPHIIIADQRMPKVNGVEFFQKVSTDYPDPRRILLTAYTSSQTVIDAVNKGHIHKYLVKPWDKELMSKTLAAVYESYKSKIELKQKNEELYRINSELNRFVYSVTHDLRAPLLSLLGLLDLSQNENDGRQLKEYYSLMTGSIRKMDDYIQTMLQYYRNLKTNLILEQIGVYHLAVEVVEPLANYNEFVQFQVDIPENIHIFTDRVRLKIALNNLITNAVKYGSKEKNQPYSVNVTVTKSNNGIKIIVSDQGKGIPSEQLKKIFDIFISEQAGSTVESSGLGLYLVRQAVDKIHGQVTVRSKVDVGTEFEITIPDLTSSN
ncbi:MAG: hybrid sensor histidine kinase/response regulator [Flavobacteriales bacterium]|nr:hybrid sensor histidine kinase/response regulator [Flavobacteriales bacterium]